MAPVKDEITGTMIRNWIGVVVLAVGVISAVTVGGQSIDRNCSEIQSNVREIKENTQKIDSLRMFQVEVSGELKHVTAMLEKIDRKLDK